MEQKSIGTVAMEASVAASTIRYYERIGLLPEPGRSGGKRRYDSSVSTQLRLIRLAQQGGFSIREIQTLLHGFPADTPPSDRWKALSIDKIGVLERKIIHLREMKQMLKSTLHCKCATLEECAKERCDSEGRISLSLCCPSGTLVRPPRVDPRSSPAAGDAQPCSKLPHKHALRVESVEKPGTSASGTSYARRPGHSPRFAL